MSVGICKHTFSGQVTIQVKSTWMEKKKKMPIVLHLQISENMFFLYKLPENTDVYFFGHDSLLVLCQTVLHWWAFREERISVAAIFPGHGSHGGQLLAPCASCWRVSLTEFVLWEPALLTRELSEFNSKRQSVTFWELEELSGWI